MSQNNLERDDQEVMLNKIIQEMKDNDIPIFDAIKKIRLNHAMDLREAKRLVTNHPAYMAMASDSENIQNDAIKALLVDCDLKNNDKSIG